MEQLDSTTRIIGVGLSLLVVLISVILYQSATKQPRKALKPTEWQTFKLVKKDPISPNTALYRFALHHPDDILGLPIGQHISIQAEINGKMVMRSYTPTSSDDDKGHFDLLIKSYDLGNISKHIGGLQVGQEIYVKGPKGQMQYTPYMASKLGMIAGGTGITPMLQLIRAALKNPLDTTVISLIYANVGEADILLKAELDELVAQHSKRFSVYYVLNNPPEGWTGGVGFVTEDMIRKHLPPPPPRDTAEKLTSGPKSHVKILLCGPPPMVSGMKKHLDVIGYEKPRTISKMEDEVFAF